jgi:glycosyltransferase involved in cell wall biosynthesis
MVERGLPYKGERIAVIATSYPGDPDDPAGHFVRAEALALARGGADVHVIAPRPFGGDEGIRAHAAGGSELFSWPGAAARLGERPSRGVFAASFALRAALALRAIAPHRVLAHWLFPSAFPLAEAASRASLEIVCHGADVRLLLAAPRAVRSSIVGRTLARADLVRFVATALRDALVGALDTGLAAALERRSIVAPPCVDVSDVGTPPARSGYAVVASRLVVDKRIDLAVRAAEIAGIPLVVIGDGPCFPAIAAAAGVTATGKLGRRATLAWVRGATAFLHPSRVDAAPTSVLEARALGVPVISCGAGDVARWATSDPDIEIVAPDSAHLAAALATKFR